MGADGDEHESSSTDRVSPDGCGIDCSLNNCINSVPSVSAMARVNVTRIWVIIDLCLHLGDVGNVISEWGVFTEMQGACCADCCTVCQPRIRDINGESTDESFRSSGSGIVALRDMKISGVEVGPGLGELTLHGGEKGVITTPKRRVGRWRVTRPERMGGEEGRIYGSAGGIGEY